MAETKHPNSAREAEGVRNTQEIRQDIAHEKENISRTVDQIGARVREKLDWRGYVQDSPYLALAAAAGLGYAASKMFKARPTPLERIMRPIAREVRHTLGGLVVGAAGPGLITVTLMGIATKAAASWVKNAISSDVANGGAGPKPQAGRGTRVSQSADALYGNNKDN
jgi:hypothetical protein